MSQPGTPSSTQLMTAGIATTEATHLLLDERRGAADLPVSPIEPLRSAERPAATLPLPGWLATALAVVAVGTLAALPFGLASAGLNLTQAVDGYYVQTSALFAVLGAVILAKRPGHVIGWVLVAIGAFDTISRLVDVYLLFSIGDVARGASGTLTPTLDEFPLQLTVIAVFGWAWVPSLAALAIALPMLVPDGRLLSSRWRPLAVVGVIATVLLSAIQGSVEVVHIPPLIEVSAGILMGVVMLASLVPLVLRFSRSRGTERQQLKWVFYGLAFCIPLLALGVLGYYFGIGGYFSIPPFVILPTTITIAVLRYRLYDIDIVISKTLLVAGLAGFITVAYVAIVVGVGSLFGQGDEPNLALSVAATAVVAVAFQPVRRGLHRVANRLVFGHRATPYDVLSGFATRVGAAEPSSETLLQLAELMARGTGADPARVWLRVGAELRPAAMWPPATDSDEGQVVVSLTESDDGAVDDGVVPALPQADLVVPVRDRGELLGVLTIAKPRGERLSEIDTDLVGRLAAASGVLLRNLRLDAELAQRLADLEASRRRLLSAQNDARQRIEEDLAGGSRAQLAALGERLSGLSREVDRDAAPKTAQLLEQLVAATTGAMETLDGLAAGVYPPRLAGDGLAAALVEQAAKAALPISVQAEGVGRYSAEVEAAVYFSVLEALQNVAKYANADSARVLLAQQDRLLSFEVADDGDGFDPETTRKGTGLQGMADRLDTVGGTLTVDSAPGAGTTITGQVPALPADIVRPEPELAGAGR